MKIAIILGTRPEIIKMSPIIKECINKKIGFFIIHSNQHYSKNLDSIFFKELNLPKPKYNLGIGSGKHGEMTGKMVMAIEEILIKERPSVVLVQGDTNTVLAGALAAVKLDIPIGHIEAGLRSFDRSMPEEVNRVMVDHISNYLFVPTKKSEANLIVEGISKKNIVMTGNTIVEAVYGSVKQAKNNSSILKNLKLSPKKFILSTIHRQENVDDHNNLKRLLQGLELTSVKLKMPVIIPAHPRLVKMLEFFKLKVSPSIKLIEPVGYLDFLHLEKNAVMIFSDSGGVQEEACIVGTPCITIRDNTERPETLAVGANVLVGTNVKKMVSAATKIFDKKIPKWVNPFGKGDAAKKIINFLKTRNAK